MRSPVKIASIFSVLLVISSAFADAQTNSTPDSLKVYRSLEELSHRKKAFRFIYKAIFVVPDPNKNKELSQSCEVYRNRIIRYIDVITLEPFGYSVYDTSIQEHSLLQIGGNFLHQKSKKFAIRNRLLFKKNTPLDPLKVEESERLLRQSNTVRDVRIKVAPVEASQDSVDILIVEQDLFAKEFGFATGNSKKTFHVKDLNFLGVGHQADVSLYYYPGRNRYITTGSYTLPYFQNTYITSTLFFSNDAQTYRRGISMNRPFYSALTKYAGGVDYLSHGSSGVISLLPDTVSLNYKVRFDDADLWAGRSFKLFQGLSASPNFVITGRYLNRHYFRRPPVIADSMGMQNDSRFYMLGMGISQRNYYRDYYIYRYGVPEDVPAGKMIEFYLGYEDSPVTGRTYFGGQVSSGRHRQNIGYLHKTIGYGTYSSNLNLEQSTVYTSFGYFSDIFNIGNWKLRQFIKTQCTYGVFRYKGESLNIYGENGIKGLSGSTLTGTNKLTLNFQTQFYLPYEFIGFRFAPFLFAGFGLLGSDDSPFYYSHMNQGYGIGLLVKNELLVVSNLQFSFGFYPHVPGEASQFIYNPVRSYDFTFRDFEIGKPAIIPFE